MEKDEIDDIPQEDEPQNNTEAIEENTTGEPDGEGVVQYTLSMTPIDDSTVSMEDEEQTKTFTILRAGRLYFKMSDTALEKVLEIKKSESVSDNKKRIKKLVQDKVRSSALAPIEPGKWDSATVAIYERLMASIGRDP